MSEEPISSYRSGRGPKDRNPNSYQTGAQIVKPGPLPRSYTSGGAIDSSTVPKGSYVYPKPGISVFFYEDNQGQNRQLRHKGQVNHPMRTGDEMVGVSLGETYKGPAGTFTKVDWVNSYVDHGLFGDKQIDTPRVGWVDVSKVTWQAAAKLSGDTPYIPAPSGDGSGSGLDTSTLGYAAIAAALVVSTKKKKKRR